MCPEEVSLSPEKHLFTFSWHGTFVRYPSTRYQQYLQLLPMFHTTPIRKGKHY